MRRNPGQEFCPQLTPLSLPVGGGFVVIFFCFCHALPTFPIGCPLPCEPCLIYRTDNVFFFSYVRVKRSGLPIFFLGLSASLAGFMVYHLKRTGFAAIAPHNRLVFLIFLVVKMELSNPVLPPWNFPRLFFWLVIHWTRGDFCSPTIWMLISFFRSVVFPFFYSGATPCCKPRSATPRPLQNAWFLCSTPFGAALA